MSRLGPPSSSWGLEWQNIIFPSILIVFSQYSRPVPSFPFCPLYLPPPYAATGLDRSMQFLPRLVLCFSLVPSPFSSFFQLLLFAGRFFFTLPPVPPVGIDLFSYNHLNFPSFVALLSPPLTHPSTNNKRTPVFFRDSLPSSHLFPVSP